MYYNPEIHCHVENCDDVSIESCYMIKKDKQLFIESNMLRFPSIKSISEELIGVKCEKDLDVSIGDGRINHARILKMIKNDVSVKHIPNPAITVIYPNQCEAKIMIPERYQIQTFQSILDVEGDKKRQVSPIILELILLDNSITELQTYLKNPKNQLLYSKIKALISLMEMALHPVDEKIKFAEREKLNHFSEMKLKRDEKKKKQLESKVESDKSVDEEDKSLEDRVNTLKQHGRKYGAIPFKYDLYEYFIKGTTTTDFTNVS